MRDPNLSHLSDDELVAQVKHVYLRTRELAAQLVDLLMEVEERRLHLKAAYPSMFAYCTKYLGMSNATANRYVVASRLAARFPSAQIIDRIERGELHLTALVCLRKHLTEENFESILEAARGKNRYELEELVATLAPQPDVRGTMRKLPTFDTSDSIGAVRSRPDRPIKPLSEARYRFAFTGGRNLRDMVDELRDLMRHRNPSGDLEALFTFCVEAGLEKLRAQRSAATKTTRGTSDARPPRSPRASSRAIPRAVRREVFERDGAQCTYVDVHGRRCGSRALVELDHIKAHARGGGHDKENIRPLCRAHNRLHAEEVFGKDYVERRIKSRKRKSKQADGQPRLRSG